MDKFCFVLFVTLSMFSASYGKILNPSRHRRGLKGDAGFNSPSVVEGGQAWNKGAAPYDKGDPDLYPTQMPGPNTGDKQTRPQLKGVAEGPTGTEGEVLTSPDISPCYGQPIPQAILTFPSEAVLLASDPPLLCSWARVMPDQAPQGEAALSVWVYCGPRGWIRIP